MKFSDYLKESRKGQEYKSYSDLIDYKNNIEMNDYAIIKGVKDSAGNVVDVKIIYKGLSSNWKDIKWEVEVVNPFDKKIQKQKFSNTKRLDDFLELNKLI